MSSASDIPGPSRFMTTHWSVVMNAGGTNPGSAEALEELCTTYWRPIHGFIRRRGHGEEEARDLTQGFFANFLERLDLDGLDPSRGRFRAYLLACVKHFVSNELERSRALKRGGGHRHVSIAFDDDSNMDVEPENQSTPEDEFERQWARSLLQRSLERLQAEQESSGRSELYEHLKPTLGGEAIEGGYKAVGEALGMTSVSVKVAAHRLKKRYGQILVEEVARTVEVPQEIDDEIAHLFRALGA